MIRAFKPHNLETLRRDLLKSANDYLDQMISQDPDDPELQHERVTALIARGDIEAALGHWSEAEAANKQAFAAATRLTAINGGEAEYQSDLACVRGNEAAVSMRTGRTKEAEAAYKEALAIQKTLVEKHPESPEYQSEASNSYHNLGVLYVRTGRVKEAEAAFKEALALRKSLLEKHPMRRNTRTCSLPILTPWAIFISPRDGSRKRNRPGRRSLPFRQSWWKSIPTCPNTRTI